MAETTERNQKKQMFQPGASGNPAGRPKGARNKATVLAERLMGDDAEAVTRAVIQAAKGGDMTAARLILDRIAPPRRGRPVELDIPPMATAADVFAALGAVVTEMAEGEITPDEASTVASVIAAGHRDGGTGSATCAPGTACGAQAMSRLEQRIDRMERQTVGGARMCVIAAADGMSTADALATLGLAPDERDLVVHIRRIGEGARPELVSELLPVVRRAHS